MNRRSFISHTLKGALVPFFMSGSGFGRMARATFLPAGVCEFDDRSLVVIHLHGANDIINSTVPLNQFSQYTNHRKNIFLPQNKLITLDATLPDNQQLGLNPGLQTLKELYDTDKLSIIQRAGYPRPNRSHFASENIWLKGVDGTGGLHIEEEGWIGRFLKDRYPTYRGLPFGDQPDPLGIMMGTGSDLGFHTEEEHDIHMNLSGQDPAGFFNIISSISGEPINFFPPTEQGELLQYMAAVEKSTQFYSERITSVFNAGRNAQNAAYLDNELGNQLKTVARFLAGGSKTKVFFARTGGWDNHSNEVNKNDSTLGKHRDLLEELSANLKAFQDDLSTLGIADKVITVIFSEFGRKIIQNDNYGTDHGTISSMFILGTQVLKGVYGDNIVLDDQDDRGAPNPDQLQNDFRGVFSSILQDWLGASNNSLIAAFPNTAEEILLSAPSYISQDQQVDTECYFTPTIPVTVKVQAKVFLEGFYDGTTQSMKTDLVQKGLLPLSQPFGNAYFSYFASLSVESFPEGTVDWILLELRSQGGFETVARKAALIKANGEIINPDGTNIIEFPDLYPDKYHLAIFHASHIAILLSETTSENASIVNSFIVDGQNKVLGENQLTINGATYLMISGDIDQNGSINVDDYLELHNELEREGYFPADLNGDGKVEAGEKSFLNVNRSRIGFPELFEKMKS